MNAAVILKKIFTTADKIILQIIKWICILCFIGLFILVLANVLIRINPIKEWKPSLHFFDEIQIWMLGAMIFWGAAGLWILRDHFKIDDLAKKMFKKSRLLHCIFNLLIELASLFFICIFTYACFYLSARLMGKTNYLRIPEKYEYLTALLIPGVIMTIYSIRNIVVAVVELVRAAKKNPTGGV